MTEVLMHVAVSAGWLPPTRPQVRIDVDHGLSVDIRCAHHAGCLGNYRLQSSPDGLCLMPPQSGQPHLSLSAYGVAETLLPAFNGYSLARSEGGNA